MHKWLERQRVAYQQGQLPLERNAKFDELNFNWESRSERADRIWDEQFEQLKAYKAVHGTYQVPRSYEDKKLHTG